MKAANTNNMEGDVAISGLDSSLQSPGSQRSVEERAHDEGINHNENDNNGDVGSQPVILPSLEHQHEVENGTHLENEDEGALRNRDDSDGEAHSLYSYDSDSGFHPCTGLDNIDPEPILYNEDEINNSNF